MYFFIASQGLLKLDRDQVAREPSKSNRPYPCARTIHPTVPIQLVASPLLVRLVDNGQL